MNHSADWQFESTSQVGSKDAGPSNVQAWARDSLTGAPVYIMELGPDRRAGHCGCECQSCNLPLIAVNAAKTEYVRRPHFRHPHGAEKSDCMFLAARLAALEMLRQQGVFELPARRMSGKVMGLSGMEHEVWIEKPVERIKIRDFDFQDKVAALITFDDGRQLRFKLIGSGLHTTDGQVVPTIFLDLKNADLAGMSPQELRARTTLIPDGLCWLNHWDDAELQVQANEAALSKAVDMMDIEGEYAGELRGIEPKFRRETLLHLEVKKILSEAKRIRVPEIQCYALRTADDGHDIEQSVDIPRQMIPLADVVLERRYGRLIPDVTARTPQEHGGVLLIEVTVTNQIDQHRGQQIQFGNVPAIEIDLSRVGGRMSRSELRDLVIENTEVKNWLCHPDANRIQQELDKAVAAELQERNWAIQDAEHDRQTILNIPVEQVARDYLEAVYLHRTYEAGGTTGDFDENLRLMTEVEVQAKRLAVHGYEEALDAELNGGRSLIVPRILSIQIGRGVGIVGNSAMDVLAFLQQVLSGQRSLHTLFLIAEAVYRNQNDPPHSGWYADWIEEVKRSIGAGEKVYVRPRRYDRLLSLLFPEMAAGLKKPFGTEDYKPDRNAAILARKPLSSSQDFLPEVGPSDFWPWNQRTGSEPGWLKGRELEQWKIRNPAASRMFFNSATKKHDKN